MKYRIYYTGFEFNKHKLQASDYHRIKATPKKDYFSLLWEDMQKEKTRFKATRKIPRLIATMITLLAFPLSLAENEIISIIGGIPLLFVFLWFAGEFLTAQSHFKGVGQRYGHSKVIKELIDDTDDYEDYLLKHGKNEYRMLIYS